jgi:hypothetical protein
MRPLLRLSTLGPTLVAGLVLLSGCISDDPGSSSLASVVIASHGPDAVRGETIRVFGDDGYALVADAGDVLTFEREPTQGDLVRYGRYGESITMRVVVMIQPRNVGGVLLRADASVLRDNGFEDKILRIARRPYQKLLDRVRASLIGETVDP